MSTENKNQHTLFRFQSLRNPELSKKKDQTKRFVFHPDNRNGKFFDGMNNRNGETKWQNLITTASTFVAFQTLEELETFVGKEVLETASWLSRNRTKFDSNIVLKSLGGIEIIDLKKEFNLWDNLFYQVVTQKDFYIKENIMHVLVLMNLIKETNNTNASRPIIDIVDEPAKIDYLPLLAQARVVLPTILFEAEQTFENISFEKASANDKPSLEEVQKTNQQTANQNIVSLETAQKEVSQLDKKYQKEFSKAYKTALTAHEKITKPLIQKYQDDLNTEKRKLCATPRHENYDPLDFCNQPDVKYPELPEFEFDFPQNADAKFLKEDLSKESYATLERINAVEDNDSYAEITEKIQYAIKSEQKTIVENTNFSTPVLLINGITIAVNPSKSLLARGVNDKTDPAFVPEKFGVRNIGIADYKKVVSHVCCYDAGEVSHIENIMAKEMRSKTTTREHIEEFTEQTETSQEKESLTDTSTTERFEMQTEVSKLLAEQKQASASANFHAGWGTEGAEYTLDVGANYATNTSKEESNRQAVTQAKDITNRAMERIVTKVRHETIRKVTDRFKEENVHVFDNREGEHHVSGIYRFVNSIYKNQIFNYGKRMMYEFMIPQPSKLHLLGMLENTNGLNTIKLQKPEDPRLNGLPNASTLNSVNANFWASKFGVEIKPCDDEFVYKSTTFEYSNRQRENLVAKPLSIKIPTNYKTVRAKYKSSGGGEGSPAWGHKFEMYVGTSIITTNAQNTFVAIDSHKDEAPISVILVDYHYVNAAITVECQLTNEAKENWQTQTFNTIIKGYETKMAEYLSSLSDNQSTRESNPGFYRQIEQLVLRKNCISYLMDESKMGQGFYSFTDPATKDLANFHINQTQDMDNYASFAKFMEQAFEWNLMSYNFYPFYWGKRDDWNELYQFECNDPLFRNFMQSGMARVVVTVKPGFENAVMHYMTTGQIWNGGEIPVLGNPLYLSIVDEIKEQEYTVEETWETVVPTSLIALQSSGVAIDACGLPCGTDCIDHADNHFKVNDATIGKKIKE